MEKKIGKFGIYDCSSGSFAMALASSLNHYDDSIESFLSLDGRGWDEDPQSIGSVSVVPWGPDNQMPRMVRDILERNNIGPGILQRKLGLLYGQGPALYRYVMSEDGELTQEWAEDKKVQGWLDSWDWRGYLRSVLTEYVHMGGHFTKYISGRAVRIGKPWIHSLECLPSGDCRFVWPGTNDKMPGLADIREILVGDMTRWRSLRLFPVFDKWEPEKHEASVYYHALRSFGRNLYALPSFHGSIPWMKNANDIADIVGALNDNVIAAAYIVHEPERYWQDKRDCLMADHPDKSDQWYETQIAKMKQQLAEKLADVMAGKRNAGKFFQCVDMMSDDGRTMQQWKIEPIEMNIEKYINAQKSISRIADSASTSGFGLSPALSNIIIDGKSDSGSQMLYALKIFYASDTRIAEEICTQAINDAIHINFPNRGDLFVGFYHKIVQKEDNVSAGERAVNNV